MKISILKPLSLRVSNVHLARLIVISGQIQAQKYSLLTACVFADRAIYLVNEDHDYKDNKLHGVESVVTSSGDIDKTRLNTFIQ